MEVTQKRRRVSNQLCTWSCQSAFCSYTIYQVLPSLLASIALHHEAVVMRVATDASRHIVTIILLILLSPSPRALTTSSPDACREWGGEKGRERGAGRERGRERERERERETPVSGGTVVTKASKSPAN